MSNNRKASTLYKCIKCGRLYQAVTTQVMKRCDCGGKLYAVRKLEEGKP